MVAAALLLAASIAPVASPLPGAEAVFECRTSVRALFPLPDRSLGLAVNGDAFSLRDEETPPLIRPTVVSRSRSRLALRAGVEGFDAQFEAELEGAEGSWRIEWRVIEVTGLRGERTVQEAGEGVCAMAGALT